MKFVFIASEELGANSEELGADYIGCYKDTNDRDLPDVFIKDYSGNTPQKCISQCETQGRYTSFSNILWFISYVLWQVRGEGNL